MATKLIRYGPNGPYDTGKWRARVKEDWRENFLGIFDSKDEAENVERAFKYVAK